MSRFYLLALVVTLVVEIPLVALLFPGQRMRMAVVCAVATTATHLILHLLMTRLTGDWSRALILGEIQATVVEAVAYWALSRPRQLERALIASGLANGASFGLGLLLLPALGPIL